jgi:hypothetical protein
MRSHRYPRSIGGLLSVFLVTSSASTHAQHHAAEPCTVDNPALFERVAVSPVLEPVILKLLERSPTFRAQCRRIIEAPQLQLVIRLTTSAHPFPVRATVRRSPFGRLDARIDLTRVPGQYAEWLGHELEHVIEHLDGVNIQQQARGNDEARELRPGLFETRRATKIGWRVADEFKARRPPIVETTASR